MCVTIYIVALFHLMYMYIQSHTHTYTCKMYIVALAKIIPLSLFWAENCVLLFRILHACYAN